MTKKPDPVFAKATLPEELFPEDPLPARTLKVPADWFPSASRATNRNVLSGSDSCTAAPNSHRPSEYSEVSTGKPPTTFPFPSVTPVPFT
ncbi:MAG: hypothetical protein RLZZ253_2911 [Verrucomicrobiota bacterium]